VLLLSPGAKRLAKSITKFHQVHKLSLQLELIDFVFPHFVNCGFFGEVQEDQVGTLPQFLVISMGIHDCNSAADQFSQKA
jgi:hypothetical protein